MSVPTVSDKHVRVLTGAALAQARGVRDRAAGRCLTCRGYGWLNVRSRPVYGPEALTATVLPLPRETCWDCGGTGQGTATDTAAAWPERKGERHVAER
jgi:hypothetical protein